MKMDGFTFKTTAPDGKSIEHSVSGVERGIVGIITNHSYLDNPTFRGMRQSLTQTFNQIYILDLHGSTKPKELVPPNVENENVFDIQKGVSIALFIKNPDAPHGILYAEFWGTRLEKYQKAAGTQFDEIAWQEVQCFAPYYMFRPLDWSTWDSYQSGWSVADSVNATGAKKQIFDLNVLGFQTHRDHFAIAFDRHEIESCVRDFVGVSLSDKAVAEKYTIKNNRDWKISDAREALRGNGECQNSIIRCAYRPFDNPYCFFGPEFMDYPRRELLDNVAGRDNIQLVVS